MQKLECLKQCKNSYDLAPLLGYHDAKVISHIIYKTPEDKKYTEFSIDKKSGGKREIKAPTKKLKILQRRLAALLYDCAEQLLPEDERIKYYGDQETPKLSKSEHKRLALLRSQKRSNRALSHGFKKGLSIASNAAKHKNKKYVLNLDIENFFPSINFGRVRGYFMSNKHFMLDPKVATILAQISCHDNALPQGSPCSPIVSDFIARALDIRLTALAKKYSCTYSRYADDITFSTNKKNFPKELANKKAPEKSDWVIGSDLKDVILKSGFSVKESKTRMQYHDQRQVVTGLVVNKTVNVNATYYRNARVMCQSLFMKGEFHFPDMQDNVSDIENQDATELELQENDTESAEKKPTIKNLEGILNHIYDIKNYRNKYAQKGFRKSRHDGYIKPKQDTDTPEYPPLNRCNKYTDESHQVSIDGIKNLYAKFLFFKHFIFLEKPLLFCEGKTDNIYYQCALKKLVGDYPKFVKVNEKKLKHGPKFRFNISFLNRTETVSEMLKMAEGSSGMVYIMLGYKRHVAKYKYVGKKHPVIMIVDNDEGAKDMYSTILEMKFPKKSSSKQERDAFQATLKTASFHHITDNLYIVPLKLPTGRETVEPEDYFDKNTKQKPFKGRCFAPENKKSTALSKFSFANDIIKPNWETINFDKFKPLLDSISEVIADYQTKIT